MLIILQSSVDCIVLWTTLGHIPSTDHARVLAECRRCLVGGGRLVVLDNDPPGASLASHQHDIYQVSNYCIAG